MFEFRRAPLVLANAALKPNRMQAFEESKRIARKLTKKLSDEELILAFARLEAEVAETVTGESKPDTAAHELLFAYAAMGKDFSKVKSQFQKFVASQPIDYFNVHHRVIDDYGLADEMNQIDPEKILKAVSFTVPEVFDICGLGPGFNPDCSELVEDVFDPRYGNCFLLSVNKSQTMAGVGMTLHIELKSETAWIEISLLKMLELRSDLQAQMQKVFNPIDSVNMFSIAPGYTTTIRYQMTHYQLNESERYGRCVRDIPRNISTFPYSDTSCRMECYLTAIQNVCGCTLLVPKRFRKPGIKYTACVVVGEFGCMIRALETEPLACLESCKPSCEYYDYAPVLSFDKIGNAARFKNEELVNGLVKAHRRYDHLKTNRVILDLAYGAMQYMKVEQKDAISVHGLISQVGGQLGLFLGASAISFFQIAATFIFCPWHQKKTKIFNKNENEPPPQIYEHVNDQAIYIPQIH